MIRGAQSLSDDELQMGTRTTIYGVLLQATTPAS